MNASEKYELCLSLYNDIINGYSIIYDSEDNAIYIKHLRDVDYSLFERRKEFYKKRAISKGLKTEEQHLEILHDTKHWSKEEEAQYQNTLIEISNLKKTRSQVFLEAQRKRIEDRIKEKEDYLFKFSKYRNDVKVETVEQYAIAKMNDYMMTFCFYKDIELKNPYFSEDSYSNLELEEIQKYSLAYFEALRPLSEKNICRVGHSSIFLNNYLLSKGIPYHFFGKKIIDLTSYQASLCTYGNNCKSTLEYAENSMPSIEDIDEIIEWFKRERSIIDKKFNSNSKKSNNYSPSSSGESEKTQRFTGIGVFDHNKEEFQHAAIQNEAAPVDFVQAAENLKKKLGKEKLDAQDLLEIHK